MLDKPGSWDRCFWCGMEFKRGGTCHTSRGPGTGGHVFEVYTCQEFLISIDGLKNTGRVLMGASVKLLSPIAVFRGNVLMGASVRLLSPIARYFILLNHYSPERTFKGASLCIAWYWCLHRVLCILFLVLDSRGEQLKGLGRLRACGMAVGGFNCPFVLGPT